MAHISAAVRSPSISNAARILSGSVITHISFAEPYWYGHVFLRQESGVVHEFFSEEHRLAPLFDVYSLSFAESDRDSMPWKALSPPFRVEAVRALWRDEWLVSGASGPTLGSNPHTLFSGPIGTSPPEAVVSATVLAGVILAGGDASIAVITSAAAPLAVDAFVDSMSAAEAMAEHSVRDVDG